MTQTTFTKLKNGKWGLRVNRDSGYLPKPREYVSVTRRDGSKALKEIGRVLWANDETALCTIR